jgi:hypothetical protein
LPALSALFSLAAALPSAEPPKAPVPKSTYLPFVYRFADTMLDRGRDTNGPQKTGLFYSALDRSTLAPLTHHPPPPRGVRESQRAGSETGPLLGANLQHDENLLRLLYSLSDLSAKPKYRDAADGALRALLQRGGLPDTGLLAWGEDGYWETHLDVPMSGGKQGAPGCTRPWLLWERCFSLAPDASAAFIEAEGKQHPKSLREAGFAFRGWAVAYAKSKQSQFTNRIETLLHQLERQRDKNSGWLDPGHGQGQVELAHILALAIDCDGAAHHVPAVLGNRLRALARSQDQLVCALQRDGRSSGYIIRVATATGQPTADRTAPWPVGELSTAQLGMMFVSRYDNTGQPGYRELILAGADAYRTAPPAGEDVWPREAGLAISLQLAAWRHSANAVYMEHARALADRAVAAYWGSNALPRASGRVEHYESITGADTLALALLELHLQILHITAVRCPSNTIDR